jgi:fatty-acyl-CoA synthase
MEFNLADLFECVAATVPDREAIVWRDRWLTYRQLDERATRPAHALEDAGVRPGDHVGLYTYNRPEFLEGMLGAYKLRAVPFNVNYRYVAEELAYLFENADTVALVYEREFATVVASVRGRVPTLRAAFVVEDGSGAPLGPDDHDYERALAQASADRDFGPRSADDVYLLYTGGTTGMPKGVMWRQEDIFFATLGGGSQGTKPLERPEEIRAVAELGPRGRFTALLPPGEPPPSEYNAMTLGPLMHASGQWAALGTLLAGCKVVLYPERSMDVRVALDTVERERVTMLTVVGDALARPLADALEAEPGRWDTSSLLMLGSGGSILSADVKERLLRLVPTVMLITEAIGSSESPVQGLSVWTRSGMRTGTLQFAPKAETTVFDDALRPVAAGSGVVGRLATAGRVPIAYYKDEKKSAEAFITVDGVRWSLPGDMATVDADGTVRVLGRGSLCINTGGEKVYPEEVEAVLKLHEGIADALVVGVPDERWGQAVTAVVQPVAGVLWPGDAAVTDWCRRALAGYKIPRTYHLVDAVRRSPSGKADYAWAREVAAGQGDR